MQYDASTASWTKLQHGRYSEDLSAPFSSLLKQTETEVAKLFEASGVQVPFRNPIGIIRLQGGGSIADDSNGQAGAEEFKLVAPPRYSRGGGAEGAC